MGDDDAPGLASKHYVDARFRDHDKIHAIEHRALESTAAGLDARLASVNEFRAQLTDQAGRFVTRDVVDAQMSGQSDRIDALAGQVNRAVISSGIAGGILGTIAGVFLTHQLA